MALVVKKKQGQNQQQLINEFRRLTWEDEVQKIKQEDIWEAIRFKEKEALSQMTLNQLRALKPSEEIQEVIQSLLPGEQKPAEGGLPGEMNSGGDMGGMPPMPPPPPPPAAPPPPAG